MRRSLGFDAVALFGTFTLAAGVVVGFFGHVAPLFDTIGQFRAQGAAVLVLLALLLLVRAYVAAGLSALATAVLGLYAVAPFMLPLGGAKGALPDVMVRYTLLQMNLRFDTEDKAETLRRIDDLSPDVVTVQEMTGAWHDAFQGIAERYPHQSYCAPPARAGDVAILSRRPFVGGADAVCNVYGGLSARTIDFDGHAVVIGSQHLRWPWPGRQWRQIDRLGPILADLRRPRLIAGDFNAAPWSASMARYAAASGTRVVAGIGPTWTFPWLPSALARLAGLPIDNVLVSDEVVILSATRTEATGSDHLPVLVTFALPFARAPEPEVQSVSR